MNKLKLSIIIILLLSTIINAQEDTTSSAFIPLGKPYVKIFTNAHTTFINGENASAFEIKRAYFGYLYDFDSNFSTRIMLDVGNPGVGGLEMTAYLKYAQVIYKKNNFKASFGLVDVYSFKMQEKDWGYRYIYKSLQDEHKFNPSADLGTHATYKFSDFISVDAMILNGEGYKKVQSDNTYKGALGITITPVKSLNLRAYYDLMSTDLAQQTFAFHASYKAKKIKVSTEYNYQQNRKFNVGEDVIGMSAYLTVFISKKFNIFGRFDNLSSPTIDGDLNPWYKMDGQYYFLGFEYNPVKGIKIAPNFQGWNPSSSNSAFNSSIYLNLQIAF